MPTVVLDPGHGGDGVADGDGRGVSGPRGTVEKDVTLALARRVAAALGARGHLAALTRTADHAVSRAQRAAQARRLAADALVSLHFDHDADPAVQGTSAWVHLAADDASRGLAAALAGAVAGVAGHRAAPVGRAPLGLLDPRALPPATRAAHLEVSYLSDPREEARLGDGAYLDGLADAIVGAIDRTLTTPAPPPAPRPGPHLDVWHEVPLVPQVTGMSCWAAAAAMLIGWRDSVRVDPEEVARAAGRWQEYRDGLEPRDVRTFAATWGLEVVRPGRVDAALLHALLATHGPLWIGEASPGLHVIVVSGLIGDGSDHGTELRVVDPWPVARGERYRLPAHRLAASHRAAAEVAGGEALILHTRGRRGR